MKQCHFTLIVCFEFRPVFPVSKCKIPNSAALSSYYSLLCLFVSVKEQPSRLLDLPVAKLGLMEFFKLIMGNCKYRELLEMNSVTGI